MSQLPPSIKDVKVKELIRDGKLWFASRSEFLNDPNCTKNEVFYEYYLKSSLEDKSSKLWFIPFEPICSKITETIQQRLLDNPKFSAYSPWIIWIGEQAWPTPYLIKQQKLTQCKNIFITTDKESWLQVTLSILNSKIFEFVVTAQENLSFIDTRKIKLASLKTKTVFFLARPPWEQNSHSACTSKTFIQADNFLQHSAN